MGISVVAARLGTALTNAGVSGSMAQMLRCDDRPRPGLLPRAVVPPGRRIDAGTAAPRFLPAGLRSRANARLV
jgi:hypothetical protein